MTTSRKATYLIFMLGLLGSLVGVWALKTPRASGRHKDNEGAARGPAQSPGLGGAPSEVREFLGRVLNVLSEGGAGSRPAMSSAIGNGRGSQRTRRSGSKPYRASIQAR